MATVKNVSKKRKFVADGVFFAELNQLFHRELDEFGFSGVEVRRGQTKTEIIIRAAKAQDVLGEKGRRIRELTRIVQNRFKFEEGQVELYAERIDVRGLCAQTQAESLRVKLLAMLPARRASYAILKFVMESGAKGCQIVISGKLRGQRAKAAKFRDGYMVKSGQTSRDYVDTAIRHVLMRQGMLGVKVQIMLPHDPTGKSGPKKLMGDQVIIKDPKE